MKRKRQVLRAFRRGAFRPSAAMVVAFLAAMTTALLLAAPALEAQVRPADPSARYPAPAKAQASRKSLSGEVVDPQGAKLAQAVVHLKDKKSLEVKTRIADDQGKYVFRGLDRDTDYEVHAEYQGTSSPNKNVSHFDDKDDVYL